MHPVEGSGESRASSAIPTLESSGALSTSQFGFRRGHSCSDLLLSLVDDWLSARDAKLCTAVVFLDLTLYHPPSQKSTVYGRWKKTSLTAKLLGRATFILRYYVIRVLRNAVAASNHIVGIEISCRNDVCKCLLPCLLSCSTH